MAFPEGWVRYPKDTVEIVTADDPGLGLAGLEGLEGWGFFKKVGRWFKKRLKRPKWLKKWKPFRSLRKLTFKKLFKAAAPLIGAGLLPFSKLGLGKLSKMFGSKVGNLVLGQKRTAFQKFVDKRGKLVVGLLKPSEQQRVQAFLKDPKAAASEYVAQRLKLPPLDDIVIPGAQVVGDKVQLPASGEPEVKVENVDPAAGTGDMKKYLPYALAAFLIMRR